MSRTALCTAPSTTGHCLNKCSNLISNILQYCLSSTCVRNCSLYIPVTQVSLQMFSKWKQSCHWCLLLLNSTFFNTEWIQVANYFYITTVNTQVQIASICFAWKRYRCSIHKVNSYKRFTEPTAFWFKFSLFFFWDRGLLLLLRSSTGPLELMMQY